MEGGDGGGSRRRPAEPCLECLHELLTASKRLRGSAVLPAALSNDIAEQCTQVKRRLCTHKEVRLLEVLCPKHSGLINDKLNYHLLALCFRHLDEQDLCKAARVCKLWREVASADEVWDRLLRRLPLSNFITPPPNARVLGPRISSKLRYMLYSDRGKWDDHEDYLGKYAIDTCYAGPPSSSSARQTVFEFQEKKKTVLVSSGAKVFPLVRLGAPSGDPGLGPRQRWRTVVRAFPFLTRGGGKWTVSLKRLSPTAVNAIGLAAQAPSGRTLAWVFNTDGSDAPITETNLCLGEGAAAGETKIKVISWHGFGEVVTPVYWRVMYNMDEDRILLDCGMRKELGCPLAEQKGLVGALAASASGGAEDDEDPRKAKVFLVMLLQDTKATIVDLCDWEGTEPMAVEV